MRHAILLLALALLVAGCGGGTDPKELAQAGYTALSTGEHEEAVAHFEKALAEIGPDHPEYFGIKMGLVEALAHVDPARAKEEFLALAEELGAQVTDKHYAQAAGRLGEANAFDEAIGLLEVGKEAYPESEHLDRLGEKLASRAQSAGDPAAIEKLRSLGYVGE